MSELGVACLIQLTGEGYGASAVSRHAHWQRQSSAKDRGSVVFKACLHFLDDLMRHPSRRLTREDVSLHRDSI